MIQLVSCWLSDKLPIKWAEASTKRVKRQANQQGRAPAKTKDKRRDSHALQERAGVSNDSKKESVWRAQAPLICVGWLLKMAQDLTHRQTVTPTKK